MKLENGISVIVCCYNSTKRLEPTLQHLFIQEVPADIDWEIIIVDNNSTDNTANFAADLHQNSGNDIDFRVIHESKPGLSYARQAGFKNSRFEFALMVDDDNWLSKYYVHKVFKTLNDDKSIGMVGGFGIPELSCEAPKWFERYAYCYATGHQTPDEKSGFTNELYGAGLALRLSVLNELERHGFRSLLSDRVGKSLLSGGDTELCLAFRMAGSKLYYRSDISFKHELPNERIKWSYLRRLFYGFGMSKVGLDTYSACLNGYEQPKNGQLPFWFNRGIFLLKQLLPDTPLLVYSKFSQLEGNHNLLAAYAKLGQLIGILRIKKTYLSTYKKVYELAESLKHG